MRIPPQATPVAALLLALTFACSPSEHGASDIASARLSVEADHDDGRALILEQPGARQLSAFFIADGAALTYRTRRGSEWSEPRTAETTWSEGRVHVARALWRDDVDAVEIVRPTGWEGVLVELDTQWQVSPGQPLARDLPLVTDVERDGDLVTRRSAAIPDWVVTREAWGARDPSKICGDAHTPRYMTIHHTVTPNSDTISAESRVRGIQAFHIDTREWCDVGYHFLVAADGRVFQGRSSELRTGAHAGGANTDNVGISLLGTFDSELPPDAQFTGTAQIVRWLADTYNIEMTRTWVKGHREWGDTSCPGEALFAELPRILTEASGDVEPPDPTEPTEPTETWDVALDVRFEGAEDRLRDGDSLGRVDPARDDVFTLDVRVTNLSDNAIRGVQLGYALGAPYLVSTGYDITSDHPALDQATWTQNSAAEDPANPNLDAGLGGGGWLELHAFSPGETKRITAEFRASVPSIGRTDGVALRTWLRHVDDVYTLADNWDRTPLTNAFGRVVREERVVDVLSIAGWTFDSDAHGSEGWTGCGGADPTVAGGALVVGADSGCARSPAWTSIDADAYDEVVVTLQLDTEQATVLSVAWSPASSPGEPAFATGIVVPSGGGLQQLVVPVGVSEEWAGTIDTLELSAWTAGGAPAAFSVDALWVQNGGRGTVAGPGAVLSDEPPQYIAVIPPGVRADPDELPVEDPVRGGGRPVDADSEDTVRVRGCAAAAGANSAPFWMLAFGAVAIARRRR